MLKLEVRVHDGNPLVAVIGDVDVASAPRLRGELVRLLTDGPPSLILDLAHVDFLDSFGIGVLIGAAKRARLVSCEIILENVPDPIRQVFELVGIDGLFPMRRRARSGELSALVAGSDIDTQDSTAR